MKAALFLTTLAILAFLSSCSSSTHLTALVIPYEGPPPMASGAMQDDQDL